MRKVCFHIVKAAHCGGKSTNDMELYPVGLLFFLERITNLQSALMD